MITRLGSNPDRLPREVRWQGWGDPVYRRTRSRTGGTIEGGARERRFHRHPVTAARTRGARDVLAHPRGVVAVNRPCAEAQPLISEPIRSPMLLTRWTTPQAVQNLI